MNYDDEYKWCPECKSYVKYLQSYEKSYCIDCGTSVFLFSKEDWEKFRENLPRSDYPERLES